MKRSDRERMEARLIQLIIWWIALGALALGVWASRWEL